MRKRCLSIPILAIALAACANEVPADTEPRPGETAESFEMEVPVMGPERHILALGDSLFAGYNLPPGESYPGELQDALQARGIDATVINAGVSGDTSAAGRQRMVFLLEGMVQKPDLLIIELGGNDLLRGIQPSETRANLAAMMEIAAEREIPVLLMGMRAPPNYGPEYQREFDALYADLAEQYDAALVPFWLESIYRRPELFQDDRIHPTEEGVEELVADTVDDVIAALPEQADDEQQ